MDNNTFISKIKSVNEQIEATLTDKTLSVSKCLNYISKPFDNEAVSLKCYEKGFNDPNSKYYQMTQQQILEAWELKSTTSRHYGTLSDDYIGMILNGQQEMLEEWKLDNNYGEDKRLTGNCNGFDKLYEIIMTKTDYRYVAREEQLYIRSAEGKYINGRFDCLFYSQSLDKFMLIDWKTTEDIAKTNKFQKLLGPCGEYADCEGNKYMIQLYMYKKALCEVYGITNPDKIDVFVCQFAATPFKNGYNYMLHSNLDLIQYDSRLLDNIIDFSYRKHELQLKKAESI